MNRIILVLLFFSLPLFSQGINPELRDITLGDLKSEDFNPPLPLKFYYESALKPKNRKNVLPKILPNNPLIVTHATAFFDEDKMAKDGIDKIIFKFKEQSKPVIYLVHDQSKKGYKDWYTADRSPDYEIFSAGGEHNLPLKEDEVTIIGGFFGSYDGARGCQTLAVRDAIRMHFKYSNSTFTVNMPVYALYFYDGDMVTRKELLELKDVDLIKKYFESYDFPRAFFLTDNFETSEQDALSFGHPMFYPKENPLYIPERKNEVVDTARYSFELYLNDVLVSKFGKGPRKVLLKMFNEEN